MNDIVNKFMNISIWLTAIFLLIRCFISWADIKSAWETGNITTLCYNFYGFIGESIGISAIIMLIFNKYAWKWKLVRWMHDTPVLAEKYTGTFVSDYDNIERSGNIIINQTFLSISVQLVTNESKSRSLSASLSNIQDVLYLIYTYQNDPRAEIQNRSPIHYGTAILDVSNPAILEGNYFTGRNSRGSIKFNSII